MRRKRNELMRSRRIQFDLWRLFVTVTLCAVSFAVLREAYVRQPEHAKFDELFRPYTIFIHFLLGWTLFGAAAGTLFSHPFRFAAYAFALSLAFVTCAVLC